MNARGRSLRPKRVIGVIGTHTEVGKTWVSSHWLAAMKAQGLRVAARKPVQSYDSNGGATDAQQLAAATGERVEEVCPPHRSYALALAPPMAADALHREPIALAALLSEIAWPEDLDVGLIETAGGARSPVAHDGDSVDIVQRLPVDEVLLVADAGLGTLNAVRLTLACLAPLPVTVFLNRYDERVLVHRLNLAWLREHDGVRTAVDIQQLQ
jgi:dethiobiotin synthetase